MCILYRQWSKYKNSSYISDSECEYQLFGKIVNFTEVTGRTRGGGVSCLEVLSDVLKYC